MSTYVFIPSLWKRAQTGLRQLTLSSRIRGGVILAGIVVLANFNIVFLGQSLVATANNDPVAGEEPQTKPGLFQGENSSLNWHDVGSTWWQWEPAGKMISRNLWHGKMPLWDTHIGGGVNAHASLIQTQYYPPYLLLLLSGDSPILRDCYYLLQVFASGLFLFLTFRNHGFTQLASLVAGTTYMLSGAMTQNVNSSIGQSFAALPFLFWTIDRVASHRSWKWVGFGSSALGIFILSAFLPVVISGYLVVLLYCLSLLIHPTNGTRHDLLRISACLLLATMLASFLLLPVLIESQQDATFKSWYSGIGAQHYALSQMLALVSPAIGFDDLQLANSNRQLFKPPLVPSPFYIGVVTILLACLAFGPVDQRHRRIRLVFIFISAFMFLKLIGAVPVQWIAYLPVLSSIHFVSYFCGALTLGVCGLAGIGVERVLGTGLWKTTFGSALLAIGVLVFCIIRFDQSVPMNEMLSPPEARTAALHYGLEAVRLGFLLTLFLGCAYVLRNPSNKQLAGYGISALVLCDLVSVGWRGRYLRLDVWSRPPSYIQFLQKDRSVFRVHGSTNSILTADIGEAFDLDVLSSRTPFNSSRYSTILRTYFDSPNMPYPIAAAAVPKNRNLLDVLNVKYLVSSISDKAQAAKIQQAGLFPVFHDSAFCVNLNPSAWPRAYVATSTTVVPSPEAALPALPTLPRNGVVVESGEIPRGTNTGVDDGGVKVVRFDSDEIRLDVSARAAGILVLTENFSSGWRARVNGQSSRIYHANYSFQGVSVPAGHSEVQFSFVPEGLIPGLIISLCALVVSLGLFLAGDRAPRRNRRESAHVSL